MDQSKLHTELVRDGRHTATYSASTTPSLKPATHAPFRASRIRADDDAVLPTRDVALDVPYHQRLRIEVVDRKVEEALDLAGVQINRNDVVAAGDSEHVGDELRRDGRTGRVLLVHARVGEAGDDRRDAPRGRPLARRDEDEELHQVVVDVRAARLDDEDVLVANGLGDLDVDLAIREVFDRAGREGDVQSAQQRHQSQHI